MSIVVEDGSLITGANSYITEAELLLHTCYRGLELTVKPEVLILKAMDYFETFSARFIGQRVQRDQALSWPRTDAVIENWSWTSTEIPRQVINAILALCIEINAGEDPFNPSEAALPAIRKKVDGAVEVQYANPSQALKVSKTQPSRTHINLLLKKSGLFAVRA